MRVLIVDDHPIIAKYTVGEVVRLRPAAQVATAGTLAAAEAAIRADGAPDFVLLDLTLPDCEGLSGLVRLRRLAPRSAIAVVSGETSPAVIRDCFSQGARGYLPKSSGADDFTGALRRLLDTGVYYPPEAADPMPARPRPRLTPREESVLQALAEGRVNKQLAAALNISESTFKTYLRNIYEKLEVRTRVQAVRRGEQLGVIETRRRS
jgi:DNA-binding NarL/FixJ family response regulator